MMVQFIAMYWLLTKYHEKYPLVLGQRRKLTTKEYTVVLAKIRIWKKDSLNWNLFKVIIANIKIIP